MSTHGIVPPGGPVGTTGAAAPRNGSWKLTFLEIVGTRSEFTGGGRSVDPKAGWSFRMLGRSSLECLEAVRLAVAAQSTWEGCPDKVCRVGVRTRVRART